MSLTKNDLIIQTYKTFANIPSLAKARLVNNKVIKSVWSQRNIEKGKSTKFQITHFLENAQESKYSKLFPIDTTSELLQAESACDLNLNAILRDVEVKDQSVQYLEIWNTNNLIRSIDLSSLELHGKVYTDDEFSAFEWSPTQKKLLFVAEKRVPERAPINKRTKPKKDGDKLDENKEQVDNLSGEVYRQDWGEQFVGKIQSILVIYDFEKDSFEIPDLPENICVAKPLWSKDGQQILGISYKVEPRKLGLIYCSNRLSKLFTLSLDGIYEEFGKEEYISVKRPLLTPGGNHLIWLEQRAGGPHEACMKMCKTKFPLSHENDIEIVVDIVQVNKEINNGKLFYGLYSPFIPKRCWIGDSRLAFSTDRKNAMKAYVLDIESGSITELEYDDGSQLVLDVFKDQILINRRQFLHQDGLYIGSIPPKNQEHTMELKPIQAQSKIPEISDKLWKNLDFSHENEEEIKDFTAIYLGPQEGAVDATVPLIVYPHGGPHSAFLNNHSLEVAFLLHHGYAILMINYRGSVGAGQKSLEYLLGRVGQADVSDCVHATEKTLKMFPCLDAKRVALMGGSHGGFLVTHLSGQYPDMYRAVITRNPVTDIATMSGCSDIPDWCYVESGYTDYTQVGPIDDKTLLSMRQKSPIVHAHKVKAPTLLQLGLKDLRVPHSQGMDYYHRLKANNVTASVNVYDDNHSLGSVPNEMGFVLSTFKWLEKYVK